LVIENGVIGCACINANVVSNLEIKPIIKTSLVSTFWNIGCKAYTFDIVICLNIHNVLIYTML